MDTFRTLDICAGYVLTSNSSSGAIVSGCISPKDHMKKQFPHFYRLHNNSLGGIFKSEAHDQWPKSAVRRVSANRKRIQRIHECARSWQLLESSFIHGSCHIQDRLRG
jgi:hypothetical protein